MNPTLVERISIEAPEDHVGRLVLYRAFPFGRRDIGFQVLVPREYEPAAGIELNPRLKPGEFQRLLSFDSVSRPHESLDVAVCRPFEVELADLAVLDLRRFGLTPYAIGQLRIGDRPVVESECRCSVGDTVRALRIFYYPNAGRVYRVALEVDADDLTTRDDDWDGVLQSFRCLTPSADPFREAMTIYRGRGKPLLSFSHPQRFAVSEIETGEGERKVALDLRQQDRVRASLLAFAYDRQRRDLSPEELIAVSLEELAKLRGLEVDDRPVDTAPVSTPRPMFNGRGVYAQYDVRADGRPLEARLVGVTAKRAGYALLALLPAEEEDPLGWMAGKRAFAIAARTLNRPKAVRPIDLALEAPALAEASPALSEAPPQAARAHLTDLLTETSKAHAEKAARDLREHLARRAPRPARRARPIRVASKKALEALEARQLAQKEAESIAPGAAAARVEEGSPPSAVRKAERRRAAGQKPSRALGGSQLARRLLERGLKQKPKKDDQGTAKGDG